MKAKIVSAAMALVGLAVIASSFWIFKAWVGCLGPWLGGAVAVFFLLWVLGGGAGLVSAGWAAWKEARGEKRSSA